MQFEIPIPALHLWRCCDPEASRYALGGVQFTCDPQGECRATATNGRLLGRVQWNTYADSFIAGTTIIPQATVAFALKMLGRRSVQTAIWLENDTLRIDFESRMLKFKPVEGRFPKADDVLEPRPKTNGAGVRLLNPDYLQKLLRIAAEVTKGTADNFCEVFFSGDENSMVFVNATHDGIVFRGAVMPRQTERRS